MIRTGLRITTTRKTGKLDLFSHTIPGMNPLPHTIEPLGEYGWLVHLPDEDSAIYFSKLLNNKYLNYINEIVPAYASVAVLADHAATVAELNALENQLNTIVSHLNKNTYKESSNETGKLVEVPVVYDGPDLAAVASYFQMSVSELVAWHCAWPYRVYAVGFQPGFPYGGYLPEQISGMARRSSPRTVVPAGSVAMAGRQTGIYPQESPGGWHLLGRTDLEIVNLPRGFFRFAPGDSMHFMPQGGGVMPDPEFTSRIRENAKTRARIS